MADAEHKATTNDPIGGIHSSCPMFRPWNTRVKVKGEGTEIVYHTQEISIFHRENFVFTTGTICLSCMRVALFNPWATKDSVSQLSSNDHKAYQ